MRRAVYLFCLSALVIGLPFWAAATLPNGDDDADPHLISSGVAASNSAGPARSGRSNQRSLARSIASEYSRLPLAFELNRGQADSKALFLAHGVGYTLFLTPSEAVLSLKPGSSEAPRGKLQAAYLANQSNAHQVVFHLEGTRSPAQVSGMAELPGRTNYFVGNDPAQWKTGIPNYKTVEYDEIYPGIRAVYYGTERQLEQDFVVSPGGDPGRISFSVGGARQVFVDTSGDLRLILAGAELCLRKPIVYQPVNSDHGNSGRVPVEGQFVLRGRNQVGFRVGAYDRSKELVIDPVLDYSTYVGGSGLDEGRAIAVDSAGEAYIAGNSASTDFPITTGAYQTTCKPNPLTSAPCSGDAFITKLSADGTSVVFSTYFGGSSSDTALGLALDPSGNAFVTGQTSSSDFPFTPFAFQQTFAPGCAASPNCVNAFLSKISADGSQLLYSTYLGGNNVDSGNSIAVDSSGNAYVAGQTASTNFPTTTTALQTKCGTDGTCNASGGVANPDVFLSELNPAATSGPASLVYSTYLGGSGIDFGLGIALDAASPPNLYVTGFTESTDFPVTPGAFQATCRLDATKVCEAEPFVVKLNPTGSSLAPFAIAYATYLGGSGGGTGTNSTDAGNAIAVDSSGKVYITGETASTDFPVTSRAFQTKCGTDGLCNPVGGVTTADAFVARLDPSASGTASLLYSTYLGGSGFDGGLGIAVGPGDVVYVTGGTDSTDFPTASPLQPSGGASAGGRDAFVASLDSTESSLLFSTYLGGSADDTGNGIAVNPSGDAYVTGSTLSTDFPISAGALQPSNHGDRDAFVTLIGQTTAPFVFLSPPGPLTFSSQLIGTTSAAQIITVLNSGSAALTITSIAASGPFAQTNACGSSLAAGASCTLNVTFIPTVVGSASGTITITDSVSGSPQTVSLSGTGAAPTVTLTPTSLAFPSTILNTSSAAKTITLTNPSGVAVSLTSITITGANSGDFSQTNKCGSSVAVSGLCTISVTFKPTGSGTRTANISITDDAAGSPQTVALSGQGADFSFSVSPSSDTVTAGQTASYTLTVTPLGGFNQAVSLTCSGAPALTRCTFGQASVTPNGSTPVTVNVSVATTAPSSTFPEPRSRRLPPPDGEAFRLLGGLAAGALMLLARRSKPALVLALTVLALALWVSCGGGSSSSGGSTPGTLTGTYPLSLNGTSSSLTHSVNVNLVVH